MARGWIVQIRHFLDEDGQVSRFPAVRRHAAFFGSIVVAMSACVGHGPVETPVRCRKSPQRLACLGLVHALLDRAQGEIHWECPVCGDWGMISGWEGTLYDRSAGRSGNSALGAAPAPAADGSARAAGESAPAAESALAMSPEARALWNELGPAARLRVLNNAFCVACGGGRAMALIGGRVEGGDLVLDGRCTTCGGEVGRLVETAEWIRS